MVTMYRSCINLEVQSMGICALFIFIHVVTKTFFCKSPQYTVSNSFLVPVIFGDWCMDFKLRILLVYIRLMKITSCIARAINP